MSERDDFLAWVRSELKDAEIAVHAGDAGPRRSIWSRQEPVTVFGAWKNAVGRPDVEELFTNLEQTFSEATSYDFEIVAADVVGDMAYTVGYEHTRATVNGEPRTTSCARRRSIAEKVGSGRSSTGTVTRSPPRRSGSDCPFLQHVLVSRA